MAVNKQVEPLGHMSAVAQAAVEKTRKFFNDKSLVKYNLRDVNVTMEYPLEYEEYPCLQIDYSPSNLIPQNLTGGAINEEDLIRVYIFKGTINFYTYALKHYESDLMGDGVIAMIMGDPNFKKEMHFNKYAPLDVNNTDFKFGSRTVTFGSPWDADQPIYYNAYNIPCIGMCKYERKEHGYFLVEHIELESNVVNNKGQIIDTDGFVTPPY